MKLFLQQILIGLLCFFPLNDCVALDTLFIRKDFTEISVQDIGGVYFDKKHEINFGKVKNQSNDDFQSLLETGISFPAHKRVYWVKLLLKNSTQERANLTLEHRNPRLNRVQFFVRNKNGNLSTSTLSGDDFPFYNRDVTHRYHLFPISIPKGEAVEVYVYCDKYAETIRLKMKLYESSFFNQAERQESFLLTLFSGLTFTICLISTLVALIVQSRLLWYYVFYCWALTLNLFYWNGYGFQYIWYNVPLLNSIGGYFFTIIAVIFIMEMIRIYNDTPSKYPRFDRLMHITKWILIPFGIYLFFYKSFSSSIGHIIMQFGILFQVFYSCLIIYILCYTFYKNRRKDQFLFLLAFLAVTTSSLVVIFENLDIFPGSFWSENIVVFGALIDMFALMFIIGNQIKETFLKNFQLTSAVNKLKVDAATALLKGQRLERQRLSQELHDGTSLRLATVKMRLSNVLPIISNKGAKSEIQHLLNEFGKVAEQMRNLTHALAPLDLSETTFIEAVEDLIYTLERANPHLNIYLTKDHFNEKQMSESQCHALYQTLQELLNNILKHAEADEINILLKTKDEGVLLKVNDDGKGFDNTLVSKGIGLKNMMARATFLNGKLDIDSSEKGSQITFSFPISSLH